MNTKNLGQEVNATLLEMVSEGKVVVKRILNVTRNYVPRPGRSNVITDTHLLELYKYNSRAVEYPHRIPSNELGKLSFLTLERYLLARGLIPEAYYAKAIGVNFPYEHTSEKFP